MIFQSGLIIMDDLPMRKIRLTWQKDLVIDVLKGRHDRA